MDPDDTIPEYSEEVEGCGSLDTCGNKASVEMGNITDCVYSSKLVDSLQMSPDAKSLDIEESILQQELEQKAHEYGFVIDLYDTFGLENAEIIIWDADTSRAADFFLSEEYAILSDMYVSGEISETFYQQELQAQFDSYKANMK